MSTGPQNGLTLESFRVVLLGDDYVKHSGEPYVALVEELDTGIPLAKCYRVDQAERIARALDSSEALHRGLLEASIRAQLEKKPPQ